MTEFEALQIGDVARIDVEFRTHAGVLTNPTTVVVGVRKPDGTTAAPAAVNDGTGLYHAEITIDQVGYWTWTFTGTGTLPGVIEGDFSVIPLAEPQIISLGELKNALGIPDNETTKDEKLRQAIRATTAAIRAYTNRDFATTPVNETRTYRYDGAGFLELDDLVPGSITAVTQSGVAVATDDYYAGPENGLSTYWLELPSFRAVSPAMGFTRNLDIWVRDHGTSSLVPVAVTAEWGWSAVPADVKQAAIWTAASFNSDPNPYTSMSIENYSVSTGGSQNAPTTAIPPRAEALLVPYRRVKI